jgi:hypothetical protein
VTTDAQVPLLQLGGDVSGSSESMLSIAKTGSAVLFFSVPETLNLLQLLLALDACKCRCVSVYHVKSRMAAHSDNLQRLARLFGALVPARDDQGHKILGVR